MKRNAKTETAEQVTEQTAEENAAKEAEFDAATDENRDLFYAVFNVIAQTVLNSKARADHGEAVTFTVTRERKGSYVASYGDARGDGRKGNVAVKRAIEAMGGVANHFTYDAKAAEDEQAPLPESAGGNAPPETYFFDDPDAIQFKAIKEVEEEIIAADKKLSGAKVDTREGQRAFGKAAIRGRSIFNDAGFTLGGEGETAKRGNKAWGRWILTHFAGLKQIEEVLTKKNALNQFILYGSAPDEVVAKFPNIHAASMFERRLNEATSLFASAVAQTVLATRKGNGDEDETLSVEQSQEAAVTKHQVRITKYEADFEKWKVDAAKAAEDGKDAPKWEQLRNNQDNILITWLFERDAASWEGSKLQKAIHAAWDEEINKPSEEEQEETAAKKATAAIVKKFAEMSVEQAAIHLLAILVSHSEAPEVYATLGDKLEDALAAKEKAAADAKAAAEKEAAEA